MSISKGTVVVGGTDVVTIIALEADGETPTPGAVVSSPTWSVDDAKIANFVANANGTSTWTGLSAGVANITFTCIVTDVGGTAKTYTGTTQLTVQAGTESVEASWTS